MSRVPMESLPIGLMTAKQAFEQLRIPVLTLDGELVLNAKVLDAWKRHYLKEEKYADIGELSRSTETEVLPTEGPPPGI